MHTHVLHAMILWTHLSVSLQSPQELWIPRGMTRNGIHQGRMFDNFVPMFPEDVADQIIYCCTRPRHVQISDISSYATNQSYFSMKGVPPVARMGASLGSENYNSDWQCYQQGWGDNFYSKGGMMGGNMMMNG